jgi:DNA-binding NtrC family response regulator
MGAMCDGGGFVGNIGTYRPPTPLAIACLQNEEARHGANYKRMSVRNFSADLLDKGFGLVEIEAHVARETILHALVSTEHNQTHAAKKLKIHRNTLHRRMQELGIPHPQEHGEYQRVKR